MGKDYKRCRRELNPRPLDPGLNPFTTALSALCTASTSGFNLICTHKINPQTAVTDERDWGPKWVCDGVDGARLRDAIARVRALAKGEAATTDPWSAVETQNAAHRFRVQRGLGVDHSLPAELRVSPTERPVEAANLRWRQSSGPRLLCSSC